MSVMKITLKRKDCLNTMIFMTGKNKVFAHVKNGIYKNFNPCSSIVFLR